LKEFRRNRGRNYSAVTRRVIAGMLMSRAIGRRIGQVGDAVGVSAGG
jgi:hypothetical protein